MKAEIQEHFCQITDTELCESMKRSSGPNSQTALPYRRLPLLYVNLQMNTTFT